MALSLQLVSRLKTFLTRKQNLVGNANLSDFLAHRTATNRLSLEEIPHHLKGFCVKNAIGHNP